MLCAWLGLLVLSGVLAGHADAQTGGAAGCSVPLEGPCITAPPAPADSYERVDYGWIPKPRNVEESYLLYYSLQIPPLLHEACKEPSATENGGEGFLTTIVAKASLLRLIEAGRGLDALRRAFAGTPPITDRSGRYKTCLNRSVRYWDKGTPDTTPGWQQIIRLVKQVLPMSGTPGTDYDGCKGRHGNGDGDWDVTMALTFRVWGLMHEDDKHRLAKEIAQRAWLQGSTRAIEDVVCESTFLDIDVPDTENHRWLIRTTKFLHNESMPDITAGVY